MIRSSSTDSIAFQGLVENGDKPILGHFLRNRTRRDDLHMCVTILPWNIRTEIADVIRALGSKAELVTAVPRMTRVE